MSGLLCSLGHFQVGSYRYRSLIQGLYRVVRVCLWAFRASRSCASFRVSELGL